MSCFMIIRTLPTPLNLHVLFAPWCIPLSQPLPLTPVSHMHLFTLCVIIKATSPMSLIASLVASSNLFCILLYLSIAVLFAGNKSTTTTIRRLFGAKTFLGLMRTEQTLLKYESKLPKPTFEKMYLKLSSTKCRLFFRLRCITCN